MSMSIMPYINIFKKTPLTSREVDYNQKMHQCHVQLKVAED